MTYGFVGARSSLYKDALREYPDARSDDLKVMKKYLHPKKGEHILEVGAGSGFFSGTISDIIGKEGALFVTDPSEQQLEEVKDLRKSNVKVIKSGAENLNIADSTVDAIWSFGAMHHVFEKEKAFKTFHRILKSGSRVVIGDVFSGSKLAKHFDEQVAKYCVTGHEVAFWSREYAESLCFLTGFDKPIFVNINQKWRFTSKKDVGIFLYKIHAMKKTTPKECLRGAEEILGLKKNGDLYELYWPMQLICTKKI